jgi:hypothetical protein
MLGARRRNARMKKYKEMLRLGRRSVRVRNTKRCWGLKRRV